MIEVNALNFSMGESKMDQSNGLICAYLFKGDGCGVEMDWKAVNTWRPEDGPMWIHLDRCHPESIRWLGEESGLDPLIQEALLDEETRPRCIFTPTGWMTILRGVNLNPGADPEDMLSIRMWIDGKRIISLCKLKLMAVQDMRDEIGREIGPKTTGDFLVRLADRMIERMAPVLENLDDQLDSIEEEVIDAPSHVLRSKLGSLRRQTITLRRYLAPQREVMTHFQTARVDWLDDFHRSQLRETGDQLIRYLEDLDAARERAAVTHEELLGRISDQMNHTIYLLSLVATIFLPLGLLTGLLGINVGGIPGAENPWAFWETCLILICIALGITWLFRRKRML